MTKVVDLTKLRKQKAKRVGVPATVSNGDPVSAMLDRDIDNLAEATKCTREEAIKIASDFYKRYPMLIEHVRSPEFMLRK